MKHITLLALITFANFSNSSEWEEYQDLTNSFYYLTDLNIKEVTCHIEVPLITNLIKQLNQQMLPLGSNVIVSSDLNTFSLKYSPKKGLSFTKPTFDIELASIEGVADPVKVEQGISMMKTGFNNQVDGVINQIEGYFVEYNRPVPLDYSNLIVNGNSVSYLKDKMNVKSTFNEDEVVTESSGNGTKLSSHSEYKKIQGEKYVLESADLSMTMPTSDIKMSASISYQSIDGIVFPLSINTSFENKVQTISQTGKIQINLTQCSI
ncbi:hypothetical protein [Marinomonas sp. PE14-40]|uniref:hypothetical protein n=1 Tax=Marinomonas sp. PE14-40 TaxID=3060621 RepID=UPI003F663C4B